MRSCSSPVLVEQAAEKIASVYLALPVLSGDAQLGGWIRRFQAQRPVRAVLVVVLDVDAKDLLQVACWVTQAPSGLAVTPARWTPRGVQLDEEQHIQPPQPDGIGDQAAVPAQQGLGGG
jgi:hypothetical protein